MGRVHFLSKDDGKAQEALSRVRRVDRVLRCGDTLPQLLDNAEHTGAVESPEVADAAALMVCVVWIDAAPLTCCSAQAASLKRCGVSVRTAGGAARA